MSRREVATLARPYTAFVGWDPPLRTFFAQIYASGRLIKWVGTAPQELREIDDLQNAIASHVDLDTDARTGLFWDRSDNA